MPTYLALDDSLIEEAVKAGNHRTKKEAVTAALQEYVQARKRLDEAIANDERVRNLTEELGATPFGYGIATQFRAARSGASSRRAG